MKIALYWLGLIAFCLIFFAGLAWIFDHAPPFATGALISLFLIVGIRLYVDERNIWRDSQRKDRYTWPN